LTDDEKQRQLHISSDFYTLQRCLIGSLPVMKRGGFNTTGNKAPEHAVKTIEFTSPEGSTHVSLVVQDHAYVFLRSQGDSSLRINCARTNGESAVLFESADKDTGICSEKETRILA
jgi:hypothetical protein